MEKVVRFYRPLIVEKDDSTHPAPSGFWAAAHKIIQGKAVEERKMGIKAAPWFGDAGSGSARAYPYIRCGRVRLPGDWPPVLDGHGNVVPLALVDGNLFETAYLVPFGTVERLAVTGPVRGMVAKASIETWLGALLDLPTQGRSLRLEPLVDEALATKLAESMGASRLAVTLPAEQEFEAATGSLSEVEQAILSSNDLGHDLDRTLVFSYGNRKKGGRVEDLLNAARRLRKAKGVSKIEVTLMIPQEDGFRTEVHDLLEDRIAINASFPVDAQAQPDVDTMLEGIHNAIEEFRKR